MIKNSLCRHAIIILIGLATLNICSQANAANEDQNEKYLQQEELNINADTSAASLIIPTTETQKKEIHTSVDQLTLEETDFKSDNTMASGDVAIEQTEDYTLTYKQRRSHHGLLFSISAERVAPVEYLSLFDDAEINNMLGSDLINLTGIELGYKYNFMLGSAYLIGSYGRGGLTSSGETFRELDLNKLSLSVGYAADAIFNEPWVVPYGQAGVHQFEIVEKMSGADEKGITTEPSLNYRLGLLFQLNWIEKSIDPATQDEGLRSSGLENTYLDVYLSWYEPSSNLYDPANPSAGGDPDMRSEGLLGVGFKMEF
ncbi:MAG: hypothetical protein WA160_07960 [Pseudobdellovibrio sp.]